MSEPTTPIEQQRLRCLFCGSGSFEEGQEGEWRCLSPTCGKVVWPIVDMPYDSEIARLGDMVDRWNRDYVTKPVDLEGFRKRVIGEAEELGFVVDVKVWDSDQPGVWVFEPEIVGRTERFEFDPDRMVHEVTEDLLDIGDKGVIRSERPDHDCNPECKHN